MCTPLFLPRLGMGQFLVKYEIEFCYTRQVSCTPDASDRFCVEIAVHATPDADDLKATPQEAAGTLKYAHDQSLHYWSTTDMRLVTRPDTLLPYICDTRQYWYAAIDRAGSKSDPVIESERVV